VKGLDPPLDGVRPELRDGITPHLLVVGVVRVAAAKAKLRDGSQIDEEITLEIDGVGLEIDRRRPARILGLGDAVFVVEVTVGCAQTPSIPEQCGAAGSRPQIDVGVVLHVGRSRKLVVVGSPAKSIQVPGHRARRTSQASRKIALLRDAPVAGEGLTGQRRGALGAGHAIRQHVDRSSDRATPVTQRGRTTKHLDLLGGQRIHRHTVVGTDRRDIRRAQAVLEDPDPKRVLPADHGATRTGRKARGSDPRLVAKSLAEGRAQMCEQVIAVHQVDGNRELVGPDQERTHRHEDLLDGLVSMRRLGGL
jgi:hypothetical protein